MLELVRETLGHGRWVRLLPAYEVPSQPLHLLCAPHRRVTPKLRTFLDFAIASFDQPMRGTR